MADSYYDGQNNSQTLDKVFTKRLADLQAAVKQEGQRLEGGDSNPKKNGTTKWMELYSDKPGSSNSGTGTQPGKVLDGFSHTEFVEAFKRDSLNQQYVKTVKPEGSESITYRDAQLFKVQIDLLAGMERELRMRYRSRVRMLAHGTARLQSHGLSIGPINKGIVNFVKLLADRK